MSLTTIHRAATDQSLQNRVEAGANKEALANPTFGDTDFGRLVIDGVAPIWQRLRYPVAVDNEVAYAYAVDQGNPDPGGDPGVITDEAIQSAVQTHWPTDPTTP
jgi:hypothetical protein